MNDPSSPLPEFLPIAETAKVFFGGKVRPSSLRRWIAEGIGRPRIKLRAIRVGGRVFINPADMREFLGATSDPELHRKRRANERCVDAQRKLRAAGA